jgi:hypothetical protein
VRDLSNAPTARGQQVTARELDKLVGRAGDEIQLTGSRPRPAWLNEREFYLAWPDGSDEWMLIEDGETTEAERRDAALARDSGN